MRNNVQQRTTVFMHGKKKQPVGDLDHGLTDEIYQKIRADAPKPSHNDNTANLALSEFHAVCRDMIGSQVLPGDKLEELRLAFIGLLQEFLDRNSVPELPERPKRDWRAREDVIAYVRSPDGLGPWLNAGVLTRPLMRKIAPRSYSALANWLRKPGNSLEVAKIKIPTKSELVSKREVNPAAVRAARKIIARHQRSAVSRSKNPKPRRSKQVPSGRRLAAHSRRR